MKSKKSIKTPEKLPKIPVKTVKIQISRRFIDFFDFSPIFINFLYFLSFFTLFSSLSKLFPQKPPFRTQSVLSYQFSLSKPTADPSELDFFIILFVFLQFLIIFQVKMEEKGRNSEWMLQVGLMIVMFSLTIVAGLSPLKVSENSAKWRKLIF